jgi:oligopeptide/dipeptide ABC transporter ATP-binding protein
MKAMTDDVLLKVRGLETRFETEQGTVHAVNGVGFSLRRGQALSLVGESGCGKSATMLSLLRLLPNRATTRADEVSFKGKDLLSLDEEGMRRIRGAEIGTVFQDPMTSLNPVLTIGRQLTESMEVHLKLPRKKSKEKAVELLRLVGISKPEERIDDYPHQFSGGMRQRALIAMALACDPSLLIADEPTTALDVTIQAQILELVARLRSSRDMAMIWITHDLGVVADIADWVAVMYGGFILEYADVERIFASPQHPYTRGLLASIPRIDGERSRRLSVIPGQPPDMLNPPRGCPFADRCEHAFEKCRAENPPLERFGGKNHLVACWWDVDSGRERTGT